MSEVINDVANTTNKPKNDNVKFNVQSAINDFIWEKTNWNVKYFKDKKQNDLSLDFFKYIIDSWVRPDLTPIFSEAVEKIKSWWDLGEYVKSINNDLLRSVIRETIILESLYDWVLKLFNNTYDFTPEEKLKLETELKKQWKWDLQYLQYWDIRRKKFLKSLKLKPKTKEDKENEKLLSNIFPEWVSDKLKDNQDFISSLRSFQETPSLITINDIKNILFVKQDGNDVLSDENKISFIRYFVPRFSYKEAISLWILSKDEAKKKIEESLENEDLTDEQKKDFIEKVDFAEFFIETSQIKDLKNILTNWKLDDVLLTIIREYKESISTSSTWLDFVSLDDFKEQVLQAWIIPKEFIEAFSHFWEWFCLEIKDKWKDKSEYIRIDWIDEENLTFSLSNITNPTWWIIKNYKAINPEVISFENFFGVLLKINATNSNKEIKFHKDVNTLKWAWIKEELFFENFESNDINTPEDLKKILDQIDPDGKNVDINKMAIKAKRKLGWEETNWEYLIDDDIYVISSVKDWFIHIDGQPAISFWDFAKAFKDRECKRFTRIDWPEDFFNKLKTSQNLSDWLKDFEFHEWKILPKWIRNWDWVKYFVWPNWEAILIKNMWHSWITFEKWEYKESKKEWEPNIFKWKKTWTNFDYNTFYQYLSSKKFTPIYDKTILDKHDEAHWEHIHKRKSFLRAYMWLLSFSEIAAWFKHVTHSIEHKLKFWNDLKAAKFAKFLWKVLPPWIQYEIESQVEQEESKLMEAKIKELKWMNTAKMIEEVIHILEISKPFDPELEAALFAIVSKTWILYPKWLKRYKWSFMWYEALWWRKWDAMFIEFKKKCEDAWRTPFTEEYLVEYLLDHQTEKLNKRRNKFNKQYWNQLKEWKKEEMEDWERKAKNKTTDTWKLDYIIGEFKNLTYWNWIWAIEWFIGKWASDGHVMWAIPFIILTSWMSTDFVPEMVSDLRKYAFSHPPFSPLYLISDTSDLRIYNEYVSKVIELRWWKDSKVYKGFKEIWAQGDRSKSILLAEEFWNEYWPSLYPVINMNDWFVLANKDDEWNEALKTYYDKIKWLHDSQDFKNSFKKDLVDGGVVDQNNSPIAATWWLISKVSVGLDWKFDTTAKALAIMYAKQFMEVMKNDQIKDESKKKKLFKHYYSLLERQLAAQVEWPLKWDDKYMWKPFFVDILQAMYPYRIELFPWKYSLYKTDWTPDNVSYEEMLDRKWNEFKNWEYEKKDTWNVVTETWRTIFDILSPKISNDNNKKQ